MNENLTWRDTLLNPDAGSHLLKICPNEMLQAEAIAYFIKGGLLNDELVIIIARTSLRIAIISKMNALGLDAQHFKNQGQIKFFDAELLLSSLLVDGLLDERAFQECIVEPIQAAQLKFGKIRAFGEMVDMLWKKGQRDRALQLEGLWDDLAKKYEFALFCIYLLNSFDSSDNDDSLEHICKAHTHLLPMENDDSSEAKGTREMIDVFGSAWNRVMDKLATSSQIPDAPV